MKEGGGAGGGGEGGGWAGNGGGRRSFGDLLSNQQIYRALSYRPASYTVPRCARLFIRLQMNKEGRSMLADQEERGARATATSPPMDSNLAAKEVSGTARQTGERSLSLSLSLSHSLPGHVIRETLISSRAKS